MSVSGTPDGQQKQNPSEVERAALSPKESTRFTRPVTETGSKAAKTGNDTGADSSTSAGVSTPESGKVAAWAPTDLTDGRKPRNWKTVYPDEARTAIRWETFYLIVLTLGSLFGVFYLINKAFSIDAALGDQGVNTKAHASLVFNGLLLSFAAGTLGGCCFGGKCLYHFIAKRLWRILAPPLSGNAGD